MARISEENITEEVLIIINDSGRKGIKTGELARKFREKFWDADDNDIRAAIGELFATNRIFLDKERYLKKR